MLHHFSRRYPHRLPLPRLRTRSWYPADPRRGRDRRQLHRARFCPLVPLYRALGRAARAGPIAYTAQHTIERDVEDIQAVLRDTGSSRLFGLSSGAVIALEAARQLDEVTHVMAYEPPFYAPDKPMTGVVQLNRDIENEDHAAAALTIMQTSQMTPALFNYLPRFASYALLSTVMGINARLGTPGYTFKDLVAASRYDFNVVSAMQDKVDRLAEIKGEKAVVVVHGSKSQAFFAPAAERVEKTVEGCKRVEVQGLNHASPWNRWSGGQPGRVAEVIMEYMV